MIITFAGLIADAWTRWRRDRGILLPLTGVFLFLPLLAWLLLLEPPQVAENLTQDERVRLVFDWLGANLHWFALRIGIELFGGLAILILYLGRGHRDVAGALRAALTVFPMYAAAVLASWGLITLGFLAFILPGLYIYGRVALTGAVLVAEPGVGLDGAIARSIALTSGHGWQVFGYLALTLMLGLLLAEMIGSVQLAMTAGGGGNSIASAILNALSAAAVSAATLARLLLEVALYRRLSQPRHRV